MTTLVASRHLAAYPATPAYGHVNTVISSGRVELVDERQRALNDARFRALWILLGFALIATVALARIVHLGVAEHFRQRNSATMLPRRGDIVDRNGELIATEQVELLWSGLVASFRSRLLALPVRCAQMVMSLKNYTEIESCLRAQVFEALSELSRYDPEQQQGDIDIEESGELGGAATVAADQPVGGSLPLFEQ